ncbi:hypothetical protein [Bradyrhizobium cenepequi]
MISTKGSSMPTPSTLSTLVLLPLFLLGDFLPDFAASHPIEKGDEKPVLAVLAMLGSLDRTNQKEEVSNGQDESTIATA